MSGFKETEIGFVPKNWQVVELGVVCTQRKEIITPNSNGKGKYVGLEHIQTGVFRLKNYGNEGDVKSAKYKFYDGDILYGKLRPYLDKAVLVDLSGICSTDIVVLKGTEQLLQSYLIGLVHTNYFIEYSKRTTSGVNHPRTSWNLLKKFKFGLPTLEEQCNIAYILSKIQSAIEAQEKIIQTTTELKKALMQKLFTEGLKGEPQKETEIGLVPKSWQVIGLGDVFELTSGKTRPTELTPMPKNGFIYPVYGGNGVLGYSKESLIDFKTIVLGRVGAYCGNVYLTDNKSWISDNALYAKVFLRECDLYYLSVALKGLNLNRLRNTGGQPLISQSIVYSQKIAFPKIDEQIEIAKTLEQTDKKINMAIEKKNVLQSLFKSMLHHLMTGQIRVKDLRFS